MKQLFSFLAAVMLAISALAQPTMPTFRFGKMNKGYDWLMSHNSHIIAHQGDEMLIATWETRGILGSILPWGLQVAAVDTNLKVLRQVTLPDTRFSEIVFANYVDGKVYLLYRGEYNAEYYRAVIEPKGMTLESCEKVFKNMQG